jgi:hypothetical protein
VFLSLNPVKPFPHHRIHMIHMIHRLLEMLGCEMRVAHGHAQVLMAQRLLNRPQIEAFHREMRAEGGAPSAQAWPHPLRWIRRVMSATHGLL